MKYSSRASSNSTRVFSSSRINGSWIEMKIPSGHDSKPKRSCMRWVAVLSAALVCCVEASAGQGSIRAVFGRETPAPNVLVIVKSFVDGAETARYLTDARGQTPAIPVKGDVLYQVIGTCPYGICNTVVREAFGSDLESGILLEVTVRATDSEGTVVGPTTAIALRSAQAGRVAKVALLVRTLDAHHQRWYHTDEHGRAAVVLPSDPAVAVIIVDHRVLSFDLASDCHSATIVEAMERCVSLRGQEIFLNLP